MTRKFFSIVAVLAFSLIALGQNAVNGSMSNPVVNAGTTGTTLNTLTKLTGAPSTALIAATTDTGGVIGICAANCGITGNAYVAKWGLQPCVFDGSTAAGDYVQISSSTAGNCHDAGSTYPTSGQVIGRVLSTNAAGGTYLVNLFPSEIKASSGGGGTTISGGGFMGYVVTTNFNTALSSQAVSSANQVYAFRFSLPASFTVSSISYYINTLSAGGNCDFGLYDSSGNLLTHTGAQSTATTGAFDVAISGGGSTTFSAGVYYFAWGCDNITAKVETFSGSVLPALFNAGTTKNVGTGANALSAGALPATLGTVTASTTPQPATVWFHN